MKWELRCFGSVSIEYVSANTARNLPDVAKVVTSFGVHLPRKRQFNEISDLFEVSADIDRTNMGVDCG